MEQINRLSRPQGSTFLSLRYQETQTEEDKQNLFKQVIAAYTLQGFMWNNKPCTINQLSQILRIPTQEILIHISELGQNMGSLATPENIENTLKSIVTLGTTWAIQDRGLISQQLNQLLTSQDGKYKPFISGEVNKALKLILESNKNLMDTYKTFFTNSNTVTNILNITNKDNQKEEQEYLSPDEALLLIQEAEKKSISSDLETTVPAIQVGSLSETAYAKDADQFFQDYGLASFSGIKEIRTGSEALLPSEVALSPDNQEAIKPSKDEDGGFKRRKIDIEDADELPTS